MSSPTVSPRSTVSPGHGEHIITRNLWWISPAALLLSATANVLISSISVQLLAVPAEFFPLELEPVLIFTVVGVLSAAIAFALAGRFSRRPIRLFCSVAAVVVLGFFLLDAAVLVLNPPGTTVGGIIALVLMQLLTGGITVGMLTTMARE